MSVHAEVQEALRLPVVGITPLAGDGSDRSYHRIHTRRTTYVLMSLSAEDGAKLACDSYDWVEIATVLAANNIPYPRIISTLPNAIIIEDCGDQTLEQKLRQDHALIPNFFAQCFDIATYFIRISGNTNCIWEQRRFTSQPYFHELEFFHDTFLNRVLRLELSPADRKSLRMDFVRISTYLAKFSRFFVHKDFHSRNIMVTKGKLCVIDFQDACIGSPLYDLISLCFDSYLPLPLSTRLELFATGRKKIEQFLPPSAPAENDAHWAALLLQRQLKAIGSFAKLTIVANKGNYLKYVQPALATFPLDHIASSRWPFISSTLITMMQEKLHRLSYHVSAS